MTGNFLITGATGFLGNELIRQLSHNKDNVIIGLGHSEKRIQIATARFTDTIFYCLDLAYDVDQLDFIIKKHNIEYIIHCAAMKHVGICEKNPYRAIEVNIIGSKNLLDAYVNYNIRNIIGVSSDKAINPTCVYGSTKLMMEKMLLEKECSIYRGVNFLFSDGSVLDIWENQKNKNENLKINVDNSVRYFVNIQDVAKTIIQNINTQGQIFYSKDCYRIELHDLAKAFCQFHSYHSTENFHGLKVEKLVEDIPEDMNIINPNIADIQILFEKYYTH